jgi:cytochrome c553
MDVADMVDIMKAFASKEESSTMMYRHAAGYSDDDLKAMAEYLKGK